MLYDTGTSCSLVCAAYLLKTNVPQCRVSAQRDGCWTGFSVKTVCCGTIIFAKVSRLGHMSYGCVLCALQTENSTASEHVIISNSLESVAVYLHNMYS